MNVSWTNKRELLLLECYQAEPTLWQTEHKDYRNKKKIHSAWLKISAIMNMPVSDLKKKRDSLMSSYRTYKKKVKDSIRSGSGNIYQPMWFAYETIDSFLGKGVHFNETINAERLSINNNEEEGGNSNNNVDGDNTRSQTLRRRKRPSDTLDTEEAVKDTLSTLKTTLKSWQGHEDDECDLHGKIIAKKLRKLPENERMPFVCEIYNMFIRREETI